MNIVVHKSPFLLAYKIILLELLIELVYLGVTSFVQLFGEQLNFDITSVSPVTQILLLPLQIGVLVYMLARWSNETYEIQAEELIISQGVFARSERAYPYRNMQSVIVKQSLLERIVGAGTVTVFVPTLGTDLLFTEVPNPKQFAEAIKKSIPDSEGSQFIMRK